MGAGLSFALYAIGCVFCALAAVRLTRSSDRRADRTASIVALSLTAAWCALAAALGASHGTARTVEIAANLSWIVVLYRLFAFDRGGRVSVRSVVLVLGFVELLQVPLLVVGSADPDAVLKTAALLRMLLATGALVLLHGLLASTASEHRSRIVWSVGALGLWWIAELITHVGIWSSGADAVAFHFARPLAAAIMAGAFAIGFTQAAPQLRIRLSRAILTQASSFAACGILVAAALYLTLRVTSGSHDVARIAQIGALFAAIALALLWLPSDAARRRAWVLTLKHVFSHRYDYRGEWIRFTDTIGHDPGGGRDLQQRAIQSLANIADSTAGLLLTPDEDGVLQFASHWNWANADVPVPAASLALSRILERSGAILEFDEIRRGNCFVGEGPHVPAWLWEDARFWAGIPLIHRNQLVGLILLARPVIDRQLDWEDFDLFAIAGRQVASYLAEQAGQEALEEAGRFDEFNRRIAFVMHDIKNLASQMSLLVRNAERHADDPEFRKDMLVTLRNSTDKLDAMLARLGRYGGQASRPSVRIDLAQTARAIVHRLRPQHDIHFSDNGPCPIMADREGLEQAIVHLVQNAIDASGSGPPIRVEALNDGMRCSLSIADAGAGMSAKFVRNELFRPFVSTKPGGFGIGAHEARATVRAMGGRLAVDSREGLGTRFTIDFPIAGLETLIGRKPALREDAA